MHEFSLAQNILEIVEENVSKHKASKVRELTLDIGSMAGVEFEALQTALNAIKEKTILQDALFKFNVVTANALCLICNKEFLPDEIYSLCPYCHSNNIKLIAGKELIIRSIVVE